MLNKDISRQIRSTLSPSFHELIERRRQQTSTHRHQAVANGDDSTRNIFHDGYDKPIVLLGCSSDASELYALANSLLSEHFAIAEADGVIQVGNQKADDLLEAIGKQQYAWPQVVVLDFGDALLQAETGQELETQYKDIAAKLYQNDLLSIYVNVDTDSSSMEESTSDRKSKLDEFFVSNSDYELCIKQEGSKQDGEEWQHIEWELARLVARARLIPAVPGDTTRSSNTAHLTMGENTFFLSLSFPDITQVEPYVKDMCQDVDAMEYRTDLLDCRDSRFDLIYGMQLLRKYCRPHAARVPSLPFARTVLEDVMPIVYTVRTQNQAGTYPDDPDGIEKMFEMLEWGLRGAVEVLDVESAWDRQKTDSLLELAQERYSSQILGSHHVVGEEISLEGAVELFEQCALDGRAHGAKVVLSIESEAKDRMAYEAALITAELAASEGRPVIPNISLILGDVGQFSRVINIPFTPVTHESLPVKAAPGQMTSNEIMATRLLTKIFQSKKYCILGHNIAYSVSPQMQGAAFAATKLPHEYVRADVEKVQEFVESDFFQADDFGGASVTIPHKQTIMPYVDELSDAAREIGSVNTLIVKEEFFDDGFKRVIHGDNTDWRGIYNPLNRLLGGNVKPGTDYALILGAGGTARAAAYVAAKLGLGRLYYNRTPSKAQDLVDSFGGVVVLSLDDNESSSEGSSLRAELAKSSENRIRVVISTLPAAAEFTLPDWVVDGNDGKRPVIFDVNYKPFTTKLLQQAENAGCDVVRGSEMLWEQGAGQFELWTGRTAPYRIMKEVVLDNCKES